MSDAAYLFAYDISSDKERAKVAKVLEGAGVRVQKSVFECRLTKPARDGILKRVEQLGIQSGFVACYPLPNDFQVRIAGAVPAAPLTDHDQAFVIPAVNSRNGGHR